nr:hypothetical protein [uncultured Pedobacter sp.]
MKIKSVGKMPGTKMGFAIVEFDEQRLNFSFPIWLLCKVGLTPLV